MCFTRTASRFQPPGVLGHFFGGEFFTHPWVVVMEFEIGHRNLVFFTNQAFKAWDFGGCFRISRVWPSFGAVYFNDEASGIQREDIRDDVMEIVRIWGLKPCWISRIFFWLSRRPTYPNFSAYWCSRKDLSWNWSFPCSHTEVIRILGRCDPTATAIFHQCRGTDGDGRSANWWLS